ncbi:MAG: aminotransferase class I and II, partial [Pedobacter sp.]
GLNLALHYLSGAITFDPLVSTVDPILASKIVWLDCFLTNMDRTPRNTNMLIWHKELWLIDHGASLYFHHNIQNWKEQAVKPFTLIKDHVLLPYATELDAVDAEFRHLLNAEKIRSIVALIPDEWLNIDGTFESAETNRAIYSGFLELRLANSSTFVNQAKDAR